MTILELEVFAILINLRNLYYSEHLHQKIRQHANVIAGTTLHFLIYRTFFLSLQSNFVLLVLRCKDC